MINKLGFIYLFLLVGGGKFCYQKKGRNICWVTRNNGYHNRPPRERCRGGTAGTQGRDVHDGFLEWR